MRDILLHLVASLVLVALPVGVAALLNPYAAGALAASLALFVRELAQIQADYDHDILSGWGDWTWHKILEWAAPAAVLAAMATAMTVWA